MDAFELQVVARGQHRTLMLRGEADLAVADELVECGTACLAEADVSSLVLDFDGVTFIDSTALGALVALHNAAEQQGKSFALTRLPSRVSRILQIAGLSEVFELR